MNKILFVQSSPRGEASASGQLATHFKQALAGHHGVAIVERNLHEQGLTPLDGEMVGAMFTPADARTPAQVERIAVSDRLIDELRDADTIVIAAGMYNFSMPSALKTWFDHVLRAGSTFRYTENGPQGLLQGKRAVLLASTGGVYSDGPAKVADFFVPYITQLLRFVGITDLTVVRAEGLALGPEATRDALLQAKAQLDSLSVQLTAAQKLAA